MDTEQWWMLLLHLPHPEYVEVTSYVCLAYAYGSSFIEEKIILTVSFF